jgi:hypothetical protein
MAMMLPHCPQNFACRSMGSPHCPHFKVLNEFGLSMEEALVTAL